MRNTLWRLLTQPPPKVEIPLFSNLLDSMEDQLFQWISGHILSVTGQLSNLILYTPTDLLRSAEFQQVYNLVAGIALSLLLPVVGWIGFKHMVSDDESHELYVGLARVVAVPIFIKLAPYFANFVINIANSLAASFLSAQNGAKMGEALSPSSLQISLLIFLIIYLFLLLKLILYYCYRNYAILAFLLFSPLVIALWAIPSQTGKLDRLVKDFTSLLVTQVIHSIQLMLLIVMTTSVGRVVEPGFPLLLFQIGALQFMSTVPNWLRDYISEAPNPVIGLERAERYLMRPGRYLRRVKNALHIK